MHHILVYGDSLTWGIVPNTRKRFPFHERWPGILENKLSELGHRLRLSENCINGRRTVWEDPFKPGRNGLQGLAQCIEMHSPLALVILMLGTNDFQFSHPHNNAWSAAQGIVTWSMKSGGRRSSRECRSLRFSLFALHRFPPARCSCREIFRRGKTVRWPD